MSGDLKLGRYRVVRKLASGGMAEVFLAHAEGPAGFRKSAVIKRILPHLADDPTFVEMLLNEAKLAAQLSHPNIVQIFELSSEEGVWFIAMEYIDGLSLRAVLKRTKAAGRSVPVELALSAVAAACAALAYAHELRDPDNGEPLGLVHRDISPENLLVSSQGVVKVVDFGIARAAWLPQVTRPGTVKGKIAYMPPEQLRAEAIDRRADVYALGITLYELLTGNAPFSAETEVGLMNLVLHQKVTLDASVRADVPESTWRILERALEKDAVRRYPDCAQLGRDLEGEILKLGRPAGPRELAALVQELNAVDVPAPRSTSAQVTTADRKIKPSALGLGDDDSDATAVQSPKARGTASTGPAFIVSLEGQPENLLVRLLVRYGEDEVTAKRDAPDASVPTFGGARVMRSPGDEMRAFEELEKRGFTWKPLLGRFNATGDFALTTWIDPAARFPQGWEIRAAKTSRITQTDVVRSRAEVTESGDVFRVRLSFAAGTFSLSFADVQDALKSGRSYVKLGDRRYAHLANVVNLAKPLQALGAVDAELSVDSQRRDALVELLRATDAHELPASLKDVVAQ